MSDTQDGATSLASNEIEEYILDQEDEGSVVDSGEFSVDWRKARSRLTSHNLIRPSAWVLYLVQAAVQWNCERLDVVQSRYLTRFSFQFSAGSTPKSTDFESAISSLRVDANTPLEKLALVVEHLRLLPESRFQVKFRNSQEAVESIEFGDLHWYDRFREPKADTIVLDINHWRMPDAQEVLPILKARRAQLEIRSELDHFCGPCPIPITLDAVRFQGLLCDIDKPGDGPRAPWFLQTFKGNFPSLALPWGLGEETGTAEDTAVCDALSGVVQVSLRQPPKGSELKAQARARSAILWVKHGVVTQVTPFPFSSQILLLSVFVSADELTSDLTGFQLVENEELRDRVKAIRDCVKAALKEKFETTSAGDVKLDPKEHRTPHPVAGSVMFITFFAPIMAVGGLISIMGLPFLSPLVVGIGGAIAGSGYWGYKKQPFQVPDATYVGECKSALENDLRRLGVNPKEASC